MNLDELSADTVAIVGVPHDIHSSFMRGPAEGPAVIRQVLEAGSANLCAENGYSIEENSRVHDLGNLPITNDEAGYWQIEEHITRILETDSKILTLGGDHAIAYPVIHAHAQKYEGLTVVQLDAHPDLYDELDGDRYSHACPFARLMETGRVKRLVQIGIRTMTTHQRAQAHKFGVEVIEMRHWNPRAILGLQEPLYLTIDLDVLDPAFAPGISHHEPGGMTMRELLRLIQDLNTPLVGADIVELNPVRDLSNMTAMVAAKLLKEVTVKLLGEG
ncbi:MAG: agmatinase [Anaerolineales bacterium]|nr:agmatinase [Anaerolineales bacterium]